MKNTVRQLYLFLSLKYTRRSVYRAYMAHAKQIFLKKKAKKEAPKGLPAAKFAVKLKNETILVKPVGTKGKPETITGQPEMISGNPEAPKGNTDISLGDSFVYKTS